MKLRATLTVEYDAQPCHYDTDDPAKAAAIDQASFRDDPVCLVDQFSASSFHITVAPAVPHGDPAGDPTTGRAA